MAVSTKEAIQAARVHLLEFLPEAARSLRLEEIEREGPYWAITFSIGNSDVLAAGPFGFGRVAKTISIDAETGEFVSLKQRAA